MTGKEFLNSLAREKADIIQQLLGILSETRSDYCPIGGLAVNAYVEPVASLDVDIVVAIDNVVAVGQGSRWEAGWKEGGWTLDLTPSGYLGPFKWRRRR